MKRIQSTDLVIKTKHLLFSREDEESPSWYLVAGGWQGLFYYESGEPGESRAGAYLYPDYKTAVIGLWIDQLLLQVIK